MIIHNINPSDAKMSRFAVKKCLHVQSNFLNNNCIQKLRITEIAKSNKPRIMKENFMTVFSVHECPQPFTVDTVIILISSIFGL